MRSIIFGMCAMFVVSTVALAAGKGAVKEPTKEAKATAMVEKGLAFIKAKGMDAAMAEFNNPKGQFIDGEFYLFVFDNRGMCLAHGANQKMVGKDQLEMMDADGKPIIAEFIKIGKTKGKAWYGYKWSNPLTKKIQNKLSFIAAIPGKNAIVGCGFYK
jgi:cytochrome c